MRISDWSSDVCSSDLQLDALQVVRLADRPHVVGDVAEAVLPQPDYAVAVLLRGRLQLALQHRILNPLHMLAALDDVGHLEDAEGGIDRGHHARRQHELELAESSEEHTSDLQSLM